MKYENKIDLKEREYLKQFASKYIAYRASLRYKIRPYHKNDSFNQLLRTTFDDIKFNNKEIDEIYDNFDRILQNKYNKIIANVNRGEPLYLVDLSKSNEVK